MYITSSVKLLINEILENNDGKVTILIETMMERTQYETMKNEEVLSSSFYKPLGDKSGFLEHVKFQIVLKHKGDNTIKLSRLTTTVP